ncbi:MAG: hypothetical protein RLZZ519_2162 [Bacteroidota bacterium]|jgi:hypothetical protein
MGMKNFVSKSLDQWTLKKAVGYLLLLCFTWSVGSTDLLGKTFDADPLMDGPFKKNAASRLDHHPLEVTLAFGDRLTLDGPLDNILNWTIIFAGQTVGQGTGSSLLNFVFSQPGDYTVQIEDNHSHNPQECDHGTLPTEILVTVSGKKMVFDFEHVSFSAPVNNGNVSGTVLSVPVTIDTYDGNPLLFEQNTIKTAGVGTNIIAIPTQNSISLNPGMHILTYTLSGAVNRPTFVMFDFVDVNGKVQSFALTQEIH